MIRKDLAQTIILDNQKQKLPKIWERELSIPVDSGKIITLTGVRRSGKTYHLLNLIQKLRREGIPAQQIVYLNFEDERWETETLKPELILQAYRELYPQADLSKVYFFFDEIQEIHSWQKFVNRLYATISKRVFITGSNANLLSKEIATALRGRTIAFTVYPLSFRELLTIKYPEMPAKKNSAQKAKLTKLFKEYLQWGGFPEIVDQKEATLKSKILQEYFSVMVVRDLTERYQISKPTILKYFCKRVVGNSAHEFSVNKIYNELKSQGYKISKDTLYSYQEYVEAIYLAKFIPRYHQSVIKQEFSQKKSYIIDQGMGASLNLKLAQDKGRLLETTIALEFIKAGIPISYHQNGGECDFVVAQQGIPVKAIQVTYQYDNPATKERELRGLANFCKKYHLKEGIIITMDTKETSKQEGITIQAIPAWEYLATSSLQKLVFPNQLDI